MTGVVRTIGACGLAACLAIAGLAVTSAQTPSRDATPAPATGTATVSGIVTTGDAPGRPLRRVTVTLQSATLRAPISAITEDDGRFELTGVAAGDYMVRASRPGYVDTVLGAPPGGILGAPIAVAEGQALTGLALSMPRGGVITGMVRTPAGRPARDVDVHVSPIRTVDGRRRALLNSGIVIARTDDRGVYRQFGLPPGEYVVRLLAGAGPIGRSDVIRRTSADEIAWAEQIASGSPAPGSAASASAPPPGRALALAPIYYPGTTNLDTAGTIALGAGEERGGVDLVLEYVPTSRVAGVVRGPDGSPQAGATVRLRAVGAAQSVVEVVGALIGQNVRTDASGAFAIEAVPPGEYTVSAEAPRPSDGAAPEAEGGAPNLMAMFATMFAQGGGQAGALHAAASVVITGADVEGLDLRLADGATISGVVVFEGTTDPPDAATVQVMLAPVSDSTSVVEQAMSMVRGASGQVLDDHTFAIRGVAPNRYRATVNLPGMLFGAALPMAPQGTPAWVVKSIRVGGGPDLADVPVDVVPGGDIAGVVVTLTDTPTVISGRVLGVDDQPTSAFPIVVFSTDPSHWLAGSRRVQQVRPANDGTYRIVGLPAGEYYVGAVTTLELDDLFDPTFLQQIVPIAFTIALAEGETKAQDLRVGG